MTETTERITVEGDGVTVPLVVWRRFRRPMPGLVERVYASNPSLAEAGPYLPVGTSFTLPIPVPRPREELDPIRLW
jgi:phage tail protein X